MAKTVQKLIKMVGVESSNIKAIGYDEQTQTCRIEFHHGGTYDYAPVEKKLWLAFKIPKSHGAFFFKHIKTNPKIKFTKN